MDRLLDELYFPILPQQAAEAAEIPVADALPLLVTLCNQGLIRREDHADGPINEKTLLVVTKKGLLKANGLE
jgi:hypothetical protein